jgi:hypothetical protein
MNGLAGIGHRFAAVWRPAHAKTTRPAPKVLSAGRAPAKIRPNPMNPTPVLFSASSMLVAASQTSGGQADPKVALIAAASFAGLFVVLLLTVRHLQRLTRERLAALATRLGLELRRQPVRFGFEPIPAVEGRHRDRLVRFFTYTTGSGKSRRTWSAVSAALTAPRTFTLELCPENFLTRFVLVTTLGMQDIQLGDPEFDRAFIVKSNDPSYAAAALMPEIRAQLLARDRRAVSWQLTIKGGEVRYAENGSFDSQKQVDRFAEMLEIVGELAEVAEVYPG